jgi:transcription initiation factor TFIIB
MISLNIRPYEKWMGQNWSEWLTRCRIYWHTTRHHKKAGVSRNLENTSTDRNLRIAFSELNTLKDKLGLTDAIIEKTAYIYRKAQERGLTRGRSVSAVITAAVYISCRELGIPKTLKEIAEANNIRHKIVGKCYRVLISELHIKTPIHDPVKFILILS